MNHKHINQSQSLKWIDWFIEGEFTALSKYFCMRILQANKEELSFIISNSSPRMHKPLTAGRQRKCKINQACFWENIFELNLEPFRIQAWG